MMPNLREQFPAVVATSVFWLVLFVAYVLFGQRHPQAEPIEIIPPETPTIQAKSEETPLPTATPAPLRIYVSGAVLSPGVYRLKPDSLVADAIDLAGGPAEDADLVAINLAHALSDGEQVYVPSKEERPSPPPPISRTESLPPTNRAQDEGTSKLIDLNQATQEELETLPGIGPAMAQRIIAGRPYHAIEDVLNVKGIGEAKFAKIKPLITVR